MKVLIISDSHGLKNELFEVLARHENEMDVMLHCGDSELPKEAFQRFDKLYIVGGNCDYDQKYEDEISIEQNDLKIFLTHGHLYGVKSSAVKLSYRAEELNCKLVCFGHSHIAEAFQENGVLYINPGSFRLPRRRFVRSYVIVTYQNNIAFVSFYDHNGIEIEDLKDSFTLV